MPPTIQAGDIFINESAAMKQHLGIESDAYSGGWAVVKGLDGFALDRKIHATGWNFFFMALELKVMFVGALEAKKVHHALTRMLEKVKGCNFNSLEVTGIVARNFLGLPYSVVSAHSRHIQKNCCLDSDEVRRT